MATDDKSLMMRRAQAAVLAHDWDAAEHLYKRLLSEDTRNTRLLSMLGDVYVKSGDDNKARICYTQVLSLDNNNYDAMSALGGIYRRLSLFDESIKVLRRALAAHKDDIQTNYNMGFTYRRMEKWNEAIECFKFVIRENPRDVLAYNHLGAIYALQKEFDKAVDSYKKGLQIDPNHPILHLNMARSLEAMGYSGEADAEYQAALKGKPGWIEAIKAYSDFLVNNKNTAQAAELVKKSIVLYPENVDMQSLLGRIYLKQCDYDNAAKTFETASDIDENDLDAVRGLAAVYEKTDRMDEALAAIKKAEDLSGEDESVEKQYAHLLLTANAIDEAGQKIKAVYDKNKEDPEALDLCGQYFVVKKDEAKAHSAWKKINEADPAYKEHEKNAAERYKQIGEMDKAQEYIEKYISSNDDDAEAYMVLGNIEEKKGNTEIARECFRLALERDKDNVHARKEENRLTMVTRYGNKPPAPTITADPCSLSPSYKTEDDDDFLDDELFEEEGNGQESGERDEDLFDDFSTAEDGVSDEADSAISEDENSATVDEEEVASGDLLVAAEESEDDDILDIFDDAQTAEDEDDISSLVSDEDKREDNAEETEEAEPVSEEEAKPVEDAPATPPPVTPQVQYVPYIAPRDYAAENALLDKMKQIAEKAWQSAQTAADNAQVAEATLRKMQKEQEEEKTPAPDENNADDASLDIDASGTRYPAELSLFFALRKICLTALEGEKKEAFLHSRERVMLDYIISRLAGRKGLMSAASEIAPKDTAVVPSEMPSTANIKSMISGLIDLSHGLKDESLSVALGNMASKIIGE